MLSARWLRRQLSKTLWMGGGNEENEGQMEAFSRVFVLLFTPRNKTNTQRLKISVFPRQLAELGARLPLCDF